MRNLHPGRLFTVRLLKVLAYILIRSRAATLCIVLEVVVVIVVVSRVVSSILHRDERNARHARQYSPLAGETIASIDYRTSRS